MAKEKIEQVESLKDIEVKPRLEKISEKHLEQLQKLVNSVNTMQFNIGKIESQKHTVLHNLSMTQDRIGLFQDTLQKEEKDKYSIYIRKEKVVIPWKDFNKNMAISIEYNLEY